MISLTPNACVALRDATNQAILTSRPLVRIIAIVDRADLNSNGAANTAATGPAAIVTDGLSYAFVALGPDEAAKIIEGPGLGLHVGSVVTLLSLSRNPANDPCPVLATSTQIEYADLQDGGERTDADDFDNCPLIVTGVEDPLQAVTAERDNERRLRRLLTHTLAHVARDLLPGHKGGLVPSVVAAFNAVHNMA
ncbi:hypothetical protein VTO73DRAFT_7070 [Trametes versicolor]